MIRIKSAAIAAVLMLLVGTAVGYFVLPRSGQNSTLLAGETIILSEGYSVTEAETLTKVAIDSMLRASGDQWGRYIAGSVEQEEVVASPTSLETSTIKNIRIIKVSNFNLGTTKLLKREILKLTPDQKVILDLRGNSGGLLAEAVSSSSLFLTSELVTTVTSRSAEPVSLYADGAGRRDVAVVVLIDASTASSAEIVAAAIQDHGRGVVVGSRSYGKASVQESFELPNKAQLLLTVGRFVRPSGVEIDGAGIEPDVPVAATGDALKIAVTVVSGLVAESGD